jgi:hypothetical protein
MPARLEIDVVTNTSQASAGLKKVAGDTEKAGSSFKSTFGAVLASGLVQNAAAKIWDFGKQSVAAYKTSEENAIKYADAMKRIPGASDQVTASLAAQAKALSSTTVFSGGQTKAGQAVLAGFQLTADQIRQLTPLMQDYATKTGKDLPSAAADMGKAILGQGRAFKGIGLDLKDTGTAAGNFAQLADGLNSKVGGLSAQMGDTAAGKMQIFQNKIGALKVALGAQLVPVISLVASVLVKLISFVQANQSWLTPMVAGVLAVVAALKAWAIIQAILNAELWANPVLLVVVGIVALVAVLIVAYQKVGWFRDAVNAMGSAIVTAWSAVVSAVKAGAAAIGAIFAAVVAAISTYFAPVVRVMLLPWTVAIGALRALITGGFSGLMAYFAGIPGQIAGALSGVVSAISGPFRAAFDQVKQIAQSAFDWLNNTIFQPIGTAFNAVMSAVRTAYNPFARTWNATSIDISIPSNPITEAAKIAGKGFHFGFPPLPTFARGAYVTGPTLGLFGEAGAEFVLPEARLRALLAGTGPGATQIKIDIHVAEVADPAAVGKAVNNALKAAQRAGAAMAWAPT